MKRVLIFFVVLFSLVALVCAGTHTLEIIPEAIAPTVVLVSPTTGQDFSGASSFFNITFTVTDDSSIENCSATVSGTVYPNESSISKTATNGIGTTWAAGSYVVYVNCTDAANNVGGSSIIPFTITAPASPQTGSGSYPIYSVNEKTIQQGYSKGMEAGWKIDFLIENESHVLRVNSVLSSEISITVSSESQNAILKIGEEKKFELTGDEFYDFYVRLDNISGIRAEIFVQEISERISDEAGITGEAVGDSLKDLFSEEGNSFLVWGIVILVGIGIVSLIYFLRGRKK